MKAYIFDLDGTLLDSMGVWLDIDVEFLAKRGLVAPDDYANRISSMSFPESAAHTIKRFGLSDSVDSLLQEWNSMTVYGIYDKASNADWEQIKQTADGVLWDFHSAPLPI